MYLRHTSLLFLVLLSLTAYAEDGTAVVSLPKSPFHMPDLVLTGRLGNTLSVSECELISGLTCSVSLKQGQTLPSRIYFVEIGNNGEAISKDIRLIYPNIKPGESGKATFRTTTDAQKLVLRGEWKGPWQSPY